jgi:hypothetical protein
MYEDVKICPECGAEYFAHVQECNECGVGLVHPEERAKMEEARGEEPVHEGAEDPLVCVEEGSLSRVTEVAGALESVGIVNEIVKEEGPEGGCSKGERFSLLVPRNLAKGAVKAIEDYWHRLHPEIKEAKEMLGKGLCPCCGSNVEGMPVCPECGLELEGPGG